jgi:crossover junction endodeoxyribonuclease RusA
VSEIRFVVYGEAAGKGSITSRWVPGKGRTISHSPASTVKWEALVRKIAQDHVPQEGLLQGPLHVNLDCHLLKPKSKPKRVNWPTTKPDIDKIARAVLDAMTGVIYRDDAQVVALRVAKFYGDPPRLEIAIQFIGEVSTCQS